MKYNATVIMRYMHQWQVMKGLSETPRSTNRSQPGHKRKKSISDENLEEKDV